MLLLSIRQLREMNGQHSHMDFLRISVGSALLILRKNGLWPHRQTTSGDNGYPAAVPDELRHCPVLMPGSQRGINPEDDVDNSGYAFPLCMPAGLSTQFIPRWCDLTGDALVAAAPSEDRGSGAGQFPCDWQDLWSRGIGVGSSSVQCVL